MAKTTFVYSSKDLLLRLLALACCRKISHKSKGCLQKQFLYQKASKKLKVDTDLARILKKLQTFSILTDVLLDSPQKMLLNFQRDNILNA